MNDLNGQLKREKIFHDNRAPRIDKEWLKLPDALLNVMVSKLKHG